MFEVPLEHRARPALDSLLSIKCLIGRRTAQDLAQARYNHTNSTCKPFEASLSRQSARHCTGAIACDRRSLVGAASLFVFLNTFQRGSEAAIVDEAVAQKVFTSSEASIVSITNNRRQGDKTVEEAAGSGLIWSSRGYIVTNYHCIQQPFQDTTGSQEYAAEYVGEDPSHDIAVLKIEAPEELLKPIKVGTSADLKVGQSVYAIGNPFGLSKTLAAGVVSGLNRGIPTPGGAIATRSIQTDAAVSSGSSGGALLDSSGRLVGISTATFSSNKSMGQGSGVNFAISVDELRSIVPNLIVYGVASGKGVGRRNS